MYNILTLDNLNGEEWLPDVEYGEFYLVSNLGRVKSLSRIINRKNGSSQLVKERILKQAFNYKNYLTFMVYDGKSTKPRRLQVHRRIAMAFILNTENKKTVNHKNGNPKDNRIENLEWATQSEQNYHATRVLGRKRNTAKIRNYHLGIKGKDHPAFGRKYPNRKKGANAHAARKIKCDTLDISFGCITDASKLIGVSQTSIHKVLNGSKQHSMGLTFRYL